MISKDENLKKLADKIEKRICKKKDVDLEVVKKFKDRNQQLKKFEAELKIKLYEWNDHLVQKTNRKQEGYGVNDDEIFSEYESEINTKITEKDSFLIDFRKTLDTI